MKNRLSCGDLLNTWQQRITAEKSVFPAAALFKTSKNMSGISGICVVK